MINIVLNMMLEMKFKSNKSKPNMIPAKTNPVITNIETSFMINCFLVMFRYPKSNFIMIFTIDVMMKIYPGVTSLMQKMSK